MLSTVQAYIAQHQLLRPGAPVIVGLSGGADSVALLHILTRLGYPCVAAHCNFHLRNDESDADADFAQQTAEALGLPFRRMPRKAPLHAGRPSARPSKVRRTPSLYI